VLYEVRLECKDLRLARLLAVAPQAFDQQSSCEVRAHAVGQWRSSGGVSDTTSCTDSYEICYVIWEFADGRCEKVY